MVSKSADAVDIKDMQTSALLDILNESGSDPSKDHPRLAKLLAGSRELPSFDDVMQSRKDLLADPALALMDSLNAADRSDYDKKFGNDTTPWFSSIMDSFVNTGIEKALAGVEGGSFAAKNGLPGQFKSTTGSFTADLLVTPVLERIYSKIEKALDQYEKNEHQCTCETP